MEKTLNDWEESLKFLKKTYEFNNFIEAFGWMTMVGLAAEKMNHHPEWSNTYNKVSVKLCTHEAGNTVTFKDHKLASIMDAIFLKIKSEKS